MTAGNRAAPETLTSYSVHTSESGDEPLWDAFVARVPGGHHVQTSLWSQVKAVQGWKVLRIIVTCDTNVVGGAQILIRPVSFISAVGYVAKGPLCELDDPALLRLVLNEVKQVCRVHRIPFLIVQPPNNGEHITAFLTEQGFRPTIFGAMSSATTLIDLSQSLDEIFAQMHKKNRQQIRRSEREGITVREGTEADLDTFYELHLATSQRRQFVPFPRAYFERMWEVMNPHGYIAMMLAEYRGEAVSTLLLAAFGDTVMTKVSGWSGLYGKYRPNEAMHWGAIRWAKDQGFRYFDFDGIDPAAAHAILDDQPVAELCRNTPTAFKLQFGGQVTLYPSSYDYVLNPLVRWTYRTVSPALEGDSILLRIAEYLRKRQVDSG
ncbi:MAG: peptidoglycan bridge formation glycyltransferase FemA/FemB family protein [Anaerolineae bacterium]|nr:peptidoglycan bridge formation glycyltransferase FemA/FemB family protein [Anaerolineae bacterium]